MATFTHGCISDLLQTAASWASRRLRDVSCKWNNPGPGTGEAGWGLLGGEVWNSRTERRQRNMVQLYRVGTILQLLILCLGQRAVVEEGQRDFLKQKAQNRCPSG